MFSSWAAATMAQQTRELPPSVAFDLSIDDEDDDKEEEQNGKYGEHGSYYVRGLAKGGPQVA